MLTKQRLDDWIYLLNFLDKGNDKKTASQSTIERFSPEHCVNTFRELITNWESDLATMQKIANFQSVENCAIKHNDVSQLREVMWNVLKTRYSLDNLDLPSDVCEFSQKCSNDKIRISLANLFASISFQNMSKKTINGIQQWLRIETNEKIFNILAKRKDVKTTATIITIFNTSNSVEQCGYALNYILNNKDKVEDWGSLIVEKIKSGALPAADIILDKIISGKLQLTETLKKALYEISNNNPQYPKITKVNTCIQSHIIDFAELYLEDRNTSIHQLQQVCTEKNCENTKVQQAIQNRIVSLDERDSQILTVLACYLPEEQLKLAIKGRIKNELQANLHFNKFPMIREKKFGSIDILLQTSERVKTITI